MIRVVLLAPIDNSLYARLVAFKLRQERGIQLAGIIVRSPWNFKRFLSEFKRDGFRLLRKVFEKGLRGDTRYDDTQTENLTRLAGRWELPFKSLKKLAAEYAIPYKVVPDHNHRRSQEFLEFINPDLVVFTGGGLIRTNILSIPTIGILNCHTGVLPDYRGMDVVEWTAAEGRIDSVGFGATMHFMDQGVDTGPIVMMRRIHPEGLNTFAQIRARLETEMVNMMLDGVRAFRNGLVKPIAQSKDSGRQYFVMHPRMQDFARIQLLKQLRNL